MHLVGFHDLSVKRIRLLCSAENYIYLLDKSIEDDKESEKGRNGTLKSRSSTVSDDSSSTGSLRRRLYANLTSLDDFDVSRYVVQHAP